ncbi:hypothetical protein PM082_007931 [Marasmius tenuissimus]|nr:hypothetical protein PM082_007931 [Marasmius tenuissimus]
MSRLLPLIYDTSTPLNHPEILLALDPSHPYTAITTQNGVALTPGWDAHGNSPVIFQSQRKDIGGTPEATQSCKQDEPKPDGATATFKSNPRPKITRKKSSARLLSSVEDAEIARRQRIALIRGFARKRLAQAQKDRNGM